MRGERGLALVSVLWAVAILSLIAAAMMSAGMLSSRISRNAWAETRAQTIADAGIQRAILALLDKRAASRWRTDNVAQDFSFDGVTVIVAIADEFGKIDINRASRDQLSILFKSEGDSTDDAVKLAQRVVDWRTPANLGGAVQATDTGPAYRSRSGPFQSVDELGLVPGMTPQLFARVEPALTVYSHRPDFDLATAPKEVLLTIPGMDEQRAEEMIAARNGGVPRSTAVSDFAPSLAGRAFSIKADVQEGRIRARRFAVIEFTGDPTRPFWILDWK
jgi:general secretion pathway protein K